MKPRDWLAVHAHNRRSGIVKSRKNKLREKELEKEIEEWENEEDWDFEFINEGDTNE